MRRAVIFLILLAIMSGIAFATYLAYSNHQQIAELNDLNSNSRRIDKNGNFSGRFKHVEDNFYITDFSYEVIDDDLYISIYVAAGVDHLETDEEGYTLIEIKGLPKIDKVYYSNGDAKTVLTADRD